MGAHRRFAISVEITELCGGYREFSRFGGIHILFDRRSVDDPLYRQAEMNNQTPEMRHTRLAAIQQEVKTSFLHNYGDCNCSTCWLLGELRAVRHAGLEEALHIVETSDPGDDQYLVRPLVMCKMIAARIRMALEHKP
jgi:hypothetical protein